MKEVRKIKKKNQKSKSRIRTGVKYIELLVKIIFALSISTWEIGQRNLLSIEKGQKRTSGLTLGNERGEKNLKKKKKIQVTNSHWCEIYRAFGKNNFRSKY